MYSTTAAEIWQELEERFGRSYGHQFFQVQKELNPITQGTNNITGYYTRIKKLWDELRDLSNLPQCTCNAAHEMQKYEENKKLMQLLVGLNDCYSSVIRKILMMKPLPSIREVYSLLIQEEKKREVSASLQFMHDSASMNVGFFSSSNKFQKNKSEGKRLSMFCDYCKSAGHNKERCYKLHGFPSNFRNNREKRMAAQVQGGNSDGPSASHNAIHLHVPELTLSQYNKLMQLINEGPESSLQNSELYPSALTANVTAATTMAGILSDPLQNYKKSFVCSSNCKQTFNMNTWIIDTGASDGMFHDVKSFKTLNSLRTPYLVTLATGHEISVSHIGTVVLADNLAITGILLVPSFHFNLVSIGKLTQQLSCKITLTMDFCVLQAPSLKKPLVLGRASKDYTYCIYIRKRRWFVFLLIKIDFVSVPNLMVHVLFLLKFLYLRLVPQSCFGTIDKYLVCLK